MATGYKGYSGYGDPERAKVDRARQLAELLQQGATDTSPKSFWEGAAQLGKAFIARDAMGKADQAETAYADNRKRAADLLISQMYPDAQGVAKQDLAAPAAFDLTPDAMEARQAQGGMGDKVRSMASLLGGDVLSAIELNEKMKPPAKEYSSVTFGEGGLGAFDPTTGTMNQIIAPTPKPAEVKWQEHVAADGTVWIYDPTGQNPSRKIDVPRARVPGEGGDSAGTYRPATPAEKEAFGVPPEVALTINTKTGKPDVLMNPKATSLYTPTEEKHFRSKAGALNTLKFLTNEYRTLVNQYGPGLFDAKLEDGEWKKTPEGQKLLAAHNNLMMFLKGPELFNLGVLTGPDVERLQRTLPEPVGMGAFGQSKETLGIGLNSLDQLVGYQLGMIPEEFRSPQETAAAQNKPNFLDMAGQFVGNMMSGMGVGQQRQPPMRPSVPAPRQPAPDLRNLTDEELDAMIAQGGGR